MPTYDIQHDMAKNQFVIESGDYRGFLEYEIEDGRMAILHTIVAAELEGQGLGAALAKHALDYARAEKFKVLVFCGFVNAWLKRHSEYGDIIVKE